MRLILVRHGETPWNRERRTQGRTDLGLTALGIMQAERLSDSLRDEPVESIYSSPLRRAMETARIIAGEHGLPVLEEPDLMELDQGDVEGMTGEELRRGYGDLLKEWFSNPATVVMPGGESMGGMQERVWGFVERALRAHPEGTILAVSHNLAIVSLLCRALTLDLNRFRRIKKEVASKSIIEFNGGEPTLTLLNDTSHLKGL